MEKKNELTEDQLKRQAIFRIVMFFGIVITIGFWGSVIFGGMM